MKSVTIWIFLIVCSQLVACAPKRTADQQALFDFLEAAFSWKVEQDKEGSTMSLEVPYKRDDQDSEEVLHLLVRKQIGQQRPMFIAFIVADNVVASKGIFLNFGNKTVTSDGQVNLEFEQMDSIQVPFENCKDHFCTSIISDGYVLMEDGADTLDIFARFQKYSNVYVHLAYPDGSHKSVTVALAHFQEQYISLQ